MKMAYEAGKAAGLAAAADEVRALKERLGGQHPHAGADAIRVDAQQQQRLVELTRRDLQQGAGPSNCRPTCACSKRSCGAASQHLECHGADGARAREPGKDVDG